jgi:hypothetical protein
VSTATIEREHTGDSLVTLAAWSMITGAVMQIVLGIPLAPFQNESSSIFPLIATSNAVSHLLLLAGVAGLVRSTAAGRGAFAAMGLTLTLLGLVVLTIAEVTWLLELSVADALYGIATLSLMLGLILAGIAVLRARRWQSWRRFSVLACGLYVPLVLIPSFAFPGLVMNYAIAIWGVCWLLLGLALRTDAASDGG